MLWNNDKALESVDVDSLIKEMQSVKRRLFRSYVSGELEEVHQSLVKEMKQYMSYKWGYFNTILRIIMKEKSVFKGCRSFVYFVEYFNCMFAPECKVESSFSIIKILLYMNSSISLEDLNLKLRILFWFKDEFGPKSRAFIKEICEEWLATKGRAPFVNKERSKKIYSTVLDRLFLHTDSCGTFANDYDSGSDDDGAFSGSESEHESDFEIDLSSNWNNRIPSENKSDI